MRSSRRRPNSGVNTITGEGTGRSSCGRAGRRRRGELAVVRGQGRHSNSSRPRAATLAARSGRRRAAPPRAVGRRHRAPARERLPPRQDGPGEADQGLRDPLHDPPFDAVLRVHRTASSSRARKDDVIRLSPALVQPIASDDVAAALADLAVGPPLNATVEVAGPDSLPTRQVRRNGSWPQGGDKRRVIADVHARYFGAELDDRSLTPGDHPRFGSIASTTGSAAHLPRKLPNHEDRNDERRRSFPCRCIAPRILLGGLTATVAAKSCRCLAQATRNDLSSPQAQEPRQ